MKRPVTSGRAEAVALLLQAGANARQPAVTGVFLGKTPLMWASSQGRTEVVKLLLLAGVDVNHSSHLGNFKVT
jgi:ankyrin repeat protein